MVKVVKPSAGLRGKAPIPTDKSITHRAVLLSALAKGISTIRNPLAAEDCLSSLACVQQLGCGVMREKDTWKIEGRGLWGFRPSGRPLDCGNSGTTMRLLAGILAGQDFTADLVGDASLSKRPMDRVAAPLGKMGARFALFKEKFAPLKIHGKKPLQPVHWKNNVASAQVKSAVLLAALHAEGETVYEEPVLSRDHSERMLRGCGVPVQSDGPRIRIKGPAEPKAADWYVPGDFSSASFLIAAALLVDGSDIFIPMVNLNPTRTGMLTFIADMGGHVVIENQQIIGGEPVGDILVTGRQALRACSLNPDILPSLIDEIPIMAVLATQASGKTVFSGLEELRIKETDRLKAMATNLSRLGARVRETQDGLIIDGPTPLKGGEVDSFLDHRIAMSMAVAGLISKDGVSIQGSESVAISFPQFWERLESLVRSS